MDFKIVETIKRGAVVNALTHSEVRMQIPADTAFVGCTEVAKWYWQSEKDVFDLSSNDFGIIRPPFKNMEFEYDMPEWILADEGVRYEIPRTACRYAVFLDDQDQDSRIRLSSAFYVAHQGRTYLYPIFVYISYDEHGQFTTNNEHGGIYHEIDKQTYNWLCEKFGEGKARSLTHDNIKIALLAISFMHCKGVQTEWHDEPVKASKKSRRPRHKAVLRYATIKLPSTLNPKTATVADRKSLSGQIMPAHWVRGHFKTYTADAPLMGKHVGSYWWSPTIRGVGGDPKPQPYEVSPSIRDDGSR